jgi:hypothetical protein
MWTVLERFIELLPPFAFDLLIPCVCQDQGENQLVIKPFNRYQDQADLLPASLSRIHLYETAWETLHGVMHW